MRFAPTLDDVRATIARQRAARAAGITVDELLANRAGLSLDAFLALRKPPRSRFLAGDGCQTCDGHGSYGRLGHMRCPSCG